MSSGYGTLKTHLLVMFIMTGVQCTSLEVGPSKACIHVRTKLYTVMNNKTLKAYLYMWERGGRNPCSSSFLTIADLHFPGNAVIYNLMEKLAAHNRRTLDLLSAR